MEPAPSINTKPQMRIGVYVCHCGSNIAQTVNCSKVSDTASRLKDVVISKDIAYACSEPGQQEILQDIEEHDLERIVVASCSPRLHEPTFRQMMKSAGLNPYLLEMANLREQCSWVHLNEPDAATQKAEDLVKMAVSRARLLQPLEQEKLPLTKRSLWILQTTVMRSCWWKKMLPSAEPWPSLTKPFPPWTVLSEFWVLR